MRVTDDRRRSRSRTSTSRAGPSRSGPRGPALRPGPAPRRRPPRRGRRGGRRSTSRASRSARASGSASTPTTSIMPDGWSAAPVLTSGAPRARPTAARLALIVLDVTDGDAEGPIGRVAFDQPRDDPDDWPLRPGGRAAVSLRGSDDDRPARPPIRSRRAHRSRGGAREGVRARRSRSGEMVDCSSATRSLGLLAARWGSPRPLSMDGGVGEPDRGQGHVAFATLPRGIRRGDPASPVDSPLGTLSIRGAANLGTTRPLGIAFAPDAACWPSPTVGGSVHLIAVERKTVSCPGRRRSLRPLRGSAASNGCCGTPPPRRGSGGRSIPRSGGFGSVAGTGRSGCRGPPGRCTRPRRASPGADGVSIPLARRVRRVRRRCGVAVERAAGVLVRLAGVVRGLELQAGARGPVEAQGRRPATCSDAGRDGPGDGPGAEEDPGVAAASGPSTRRQDEVVDLDRGPQPAVLVGPGPQRSSPSCQLQVVGRCDISATQPAMPCSAGSRKRSSTAGSGSGAWPSGVGPWG